MHPHNFRFILDHNAVFIETPDVEKREKPVKHKIYVWKETDEKKCQNLLTLNTVP